MSKILCQNRQKIAQLIYQHDPSDLFSVEDIINQFKEKNPGRDPVISGTETVKEYMNELTHLGVLGRDGNYYYISFKGNLR
ncbi:MAG: hypothetical protein ACOCQD_00430 [archaeon]